MRDDLASPFAAIWNLLGHAALSRARPTEYAQRSPNDEVVEDLSSVEHHSGTRYFRSLRFDGDSCEVLLSSPGGDQELLTFRYVRSLLFIKESDFFGEIALYEKLPLKTDTGDASSAFQIIKNTIIGGALSNRLEDEQPLYFGVWTPDECFEFACFETPTISFRAAG